MVADALARRRRARWTFAGPGSPRVATPRRRRCRPEHRAAPADRHTKLLAVDELSAAQRIAEVPGQIVGSVNLIAASHILPLADLTSGIAPE